MHLPYKKTLNSFFTASIIFLSIPTFAILISWNSLPNSKLYPLKRNLETIDLALLPDSLLKIDFRLKLIDRRFNEAMASLFNQNSDQGLNELVGQARDMELALENLSPQTQKQAAYKTVYKLKQTNQKLKQIKPAAHQTPSTTAPLPSAVIIQTQNDLADIIEELEKRIAELENQPTPAPSPSPPADQPPAGPPAGDQPASPSEQPAPAAPAPAKNISEDQSASESSTTSEEKSQQNSTD